MADTHTNANLFCFKQEPVKASPSRMRPLIVRNSQVKTLNNANRFQKTLKLRDKFAKKTNAYAINYTSSKNNLSHPRVANNTNVQEYFNNPAERCDTEVVNLVTGNKLTTEDSLTPETKVKEDIIEPLADRMNNVIEMLKESEDMLENSKEVKVEFPIVDIKVQDESDFSVPHKLKAASLNCKAKFTLSRDGNSGALPSNDRDELSHEESNSNKSSDEGDSEQSFTSKNHESKKSNSSENMLKESRSSAIYFAQKKREVEDSNKEDSKSALSNLSCDFINAKRTNRGEDEDEKLNKRREDQLEDLVIISSNNSINNNYDNSSTPERSVKGKANPFADIMDNAITKYLAGNTQPQVRISKDLLKNLAKQKESTSKFIQTPSLLNKRIAESIIELSSSSVFHMESGNNTHK